MKQSRLPCVIFDLDGTLADCAHRLHYIKQRPKDWGAFFQAMAEDAPKEEMAWLFRATRNSKTPTNSVLIARACFPVPVICTGRPDNYREATEAWLLHHSLLPHALYMRSEGDCRDDDIVKKELLAQIILDGYEPILVIENRDRVVNMWRDAGLTCLQCAPGDF